MKKALSWKNFWIITGYLSSVVSALLFLFAGILFSDSLPNSEIVSYRVLFFVNSLFAVGAVWSLQKLSYWPIKLVLTTLILFSSRIFYITLIDNTPIENANFAEEYAIDLLEYTDSLNKTKEAYIDSVQKKNFGYLSLKVNPIFPLVDIYNKDAEYFPNKRIDQKEEWIWFADKVEKTKINGQEVRRLRGNVRFIKTDQIILTDNSDHYIKDDILHLNGNTLMINNLDTLTCESMVYWSKLDSGYAMGNVHLMKRLTSGLHTLNVLPDGYDGYKGSFNIKQDETTNLDIQLTERSDLSSSTNPNVKFIPYDKDPKPKIPIRPVYPKSAQENGLEGTVYIQFFIDKKGNVTEAWVQKGIPNTGFNEAALEAVKKSKWKPAQQRSKKVGVWQTVPIKFELLD